MRRPRPRNRQRGAGRVVGCEARRLREAVGARIERDFHGERVAQFPVDLRERAFLLTGKGRRPQPVAMLGFHCCSSLDLEVVVIAGAGPTVSARGRGPASRAAASRLVDGHNGSELMAGGVGRAEIGVAGTLSENVLVVISAGSGSAHRHKDALFPAAYRPKKPEDVNRTPPTGSASTASAPCSTMRSNARVAARRSPTSCAPA